MEIRKSGTRRGIECIHYFESSLISCSIVLPLWNFGEEAKTRQGGASGTQTWCIFANRTNIERQIIIILILKCAHSVYIGTFINKYMSLIYTSTLPVARKHYTMPVIILSVLCLLYICYIFFKIRGCMSTVHWILFFYIVLRCCECTARQNLVIIDKL